MGGELDAADDRVVDGVGRRDALRLEGGDDRLVVEHLRHAGAHADHPGALVEERVRRALVEAGGQVGLRQEDVALGLEEQVRELVRLVAARLVPAAEGDVEADREAREERRAVRVPQVDDLVELEPERLDELEGTRPVQPAGVDVRAVVGVEVLVGAARRERRGVALHVEQREQEPERLDRLVEGLGAADAQLVADPGDLAEVGDALGGLGRGGHVRREVRVPAHEVHRRIEDDEHGVVELALVGRRGRGPRGRLGADAGRTQADPLRGVGADVALGVVLLVDLDHAGDGVEKGAVLGPEGVLEGLALPVREDPLAEGGGVLGVDVELVLGPRRHRVELAVDPADAGLREDDAAANTGGAVADDELVRVDVDVEPAHRLGEGQGALARGAVALVGLVDVGDDQRLLDRQVARLIEHPLLERADARSGLALAPARQRARWRAVRPGSSAYLLE